MLLYDFIRKNSQICHIVLVIIVNLITTLTLFIINYKSAEYSGMAKLTNTQDNMETDVDRSEDDQLEELILKESIVSAADLNSEPVLIGIKGDPSLRESAHL